ncbi:hypothetical protein L6R53_31965 [Myxococcota bacterium]|nr:hypothetical protein [Myxococcota bacterium]
MRRAHRLRRARLGQALRSALGQALRAAAALAVVTVGLGLAIAVAERDFLPDVDRVLYDMRVLEGANDDKIGEILSADRVAQDLPRRWRMRLDDALHGRVAGLIFLPQASIGLAARHLPVVPAYNLLTFGAWVLTATGTWLVGRRLGASAGGAFVGALLFALSPAALVIFRSRSLDYGFMFWLPLYAAGLLGARQRGRVGDLALVFVSVLGMAVTCYYHLVAAAGFGAAVLGLTLLAAAPAARRDPQALRPVLRLLGVAAVAFVACAPQVIPEAIALASLRAGSPDVITVEWIPRLDGAAEVLRRLELLPTWTAVVGALALASLWQPADGPTRALRRVVLLSSLLGVLAVAAAFTFRDATVALLERLPLLYRLRRIEVLPLLPWMLVSASAGAALSAPAALSTRLRLLPVAVGLALVAFTVHRTARETRSYAGPDDRLHIPAEVLRAVDDRLPAPAPCAVHFVPSQARHRTALAFYLHTWTRCEPLSPPMEWTAALDLQEGDPAMAPPQVNTGVAPMPTATAEELLAALQPACGLLVVHQDGGSRLEVDRDLVPRLEALGLQVEAPAPRWWVARPPGCAGAP